MGFDTSFHPVDLDVAHRVASYIGGHGSIDDLVAQSVRHAHVRFRANAWGLGLSKLRKDAPKAFDPWLHVWGRPYFIAVEGTEAIAAMIDRYLAARSEDEADAIAKENLEAIAPGLSSKVRPSIDEKLPDDAALASSIRGNVDLVKNAREAAEKKLPFSLPDGEKTDPKKLLSREAVMQILSFAAAFRPGWMDRGYVWPTALFAELAVPVGDLFAAPKALLGSLADAPGPWFLEPTLTENYMAGGFVTAANMPKLCARLEEHRSKLERCYSKDGTPELATTVKKLLEAANDARLRKLPFVEATEVYSGFGGSLN